MVIVSVRALNIDNNVIYFARGTKFLIGKFTSYFLLKLFSQDLFYLILIKLYILFKLYLSIFKGGINYFLILRKKEGLYGDIKDIAIITDLVLFSVKSSLNSSLFKP